LRVLVTGGAGYIGSVMVRMLHSHEHDVLVFDNLSKGHRSAVGEAPLEIGELTNLEDITRVCESFLPEACMHFAAHSLVDESVRDPLKYMRDNPVGSLNLARALCECGCRYLVFSSTCAVYGVPEKVPITEDEKTEPINPYGASKLLIEQALSELAKRGVLSFVSLRYFNAAGADVENDLGEDHQPETHLIPRVIKAALGIEQSAVIYGNDYPTSDGTCVRDYIHVVDLCKAHLLALDYLKGGGDSLILNLGNGNGFTVKEVVDSVKRVSKKDFQVRVESRREGDPPILVASSEKIRSKLKWAPSYTDIDQIVETAWIWHSRHPEGYGD